MHVFGDQFRFLARYAKETDQERTSAPNAQNTADTKPTRARASWGCAKADGSQNRAKEEAKKKNTATSAIFPLSIGLGIGCLRFRVQAIVSSGKAIPVFRTDWPTGSSAGIEPGTVQNRENDHAAFVHFVRNQIRRSRNDELTRAGVTAWAAKVWVTRKTLNGFYNLPCYTSGGRWLVLLDVCPNFDEVFNCGWRPDYSHTGGGSSRFLPQERSQRDTFS